MIVNKVKTLFDTENKKRLISNFLSLVVLRGFRFLIPLLTLPYLVRTIGIENYGLVNFALSLGVYFGAVIQFGFGVTATRQIARYRDDAIELQKIFSATLSASIILACVSSVVFLVVVLSIDRFSSNLDLYLFTLLFVVFQNLFPIWFFQGMEKMKYITFITLSGNLFFLLTLFLFVKDQNDFILVPLLNAIVVFFTFLIAIWIIKKQFKISFVVPEWTEVKTIFKDGRHAFISQLAPNFYNNSALFLLGVFSGNAVVGLYAAAAKVIDAVISLGYILSNTFLPYLSRDLSKHPSFQKLMFVSGLFLTIAVIIGADFIAILLFGDENIIVATYIRWMAICIVSLFVSLTYGTNYLMLVGKDVIVKNIALYVSLIFFAIAFVVIPFLGIWGAVLVLVGARMVMASVSYMYYKKTNIIN